MKKILILSVSILLIVGISYGQIPREITYQGYLTDNANNPITSNIQLTFTLYDAQSGGSSLWTEVQPGVAIIQGVFRVSLGSITPLNLPFDAPYWLGIKVAGDPELIPRISLTGVGYSFNSIRAEGVADNSITTAGIQNGAITQAKLEPGLSLPPGGTAGGDLTGTYPDPSIATAAVTLGKISSAGASAGQTITYNGTSIVWQAPGGIGGSGTLNYLPKFASSTSLGNSLIYDTGSRLGIGTTSPADLVSVVEGNREADLCYYYTPPPPAFYHNEAGVRGSYSTEVYGELAHHYTVNTVPPTSQSYGVYGYASSASFKAGFFDGDVQVTGSLSKGGGSFKIDHPLDPQNKYLYHSFVESPDMMNIYNGNVVLDGNGEAWVQLPEWFEALNQDFRYQLTCIGGFAPVYIAQKISGNQFKIAGGTAGMEISWLVTGIRHDAYAQKYRIPVEVQKAPAEQGKYLHPEAFGLPKNMGIYYEMSQSPENQ